MRPRLYLSLLTGILLCLAGWTTHAQLQKSAPAPAARAWEYRVLNNPTNSRYIAEKMLNDAGAQGWELVGISGNDCFLKRAK